MNIFKEVLDELLKDRDEIKVLEQIKRLEDNIKRERLTFYKNTTPKIYHNASIKNIDNGIKDFFYNDKIFCWITGCYGSGKTKSLHAIRHFFIMKGKIYFAIKTEGELNYETNYKNINAIDNVGMGDNKYKFLADVYFNLFDWKWKTQKKLFITSTLTPDQWLNEMSKFNDIAAHSIESRIYNTTDIIKLKEVDYRKEKL